MQLQQIRQPTPQARQRHTMTAVQHNLETRLDALDSKLDTKLDELTRAVLRIEGNVPSRADMAAEMAKRVSIERFDGEMGGLRDRLIRLESGPQKLLGWVSLIVSGVVGIVASAIGCLSLLLVAAGILITVALTVIPHLH